MSCVTASPPGMSDLTCPGEVLLYIVQFLQKTTVLLQMDDLLNEIRQLKDELRKKDETINQLEQQLVSIIRNV